MLLLLLALLDPLVGHLVELGGQALGGAFAQRLLEESAGVLTGWAGKALGLHDDRALGINGDLDRLQMPPPPTDTVSLIDPSASNRSLTLCPALRASSLAFSTA